MKFKKGDKVIVCNDLVTTIMKYKNGLYYFKGNDNITYTEVESAIEFYNIKELKQKLNSMVNKNIKAISFDLWGTLIKSNPEYKEKRLDLIQQYTTMSRYEIQYNIDTIKKNIDVLVEKFGFHYNAEDIYFSIMNKCNINTTEVNLKELCEDLFLKYPPVLIDNDLPELLKELAKNYTLVISSNTVLINGFYLERTLYGLGIIYSFNHAFFSNEIGHSKPNPLFFKDVHSKLGLLTNEIVHIGDNQKTDILGAMNYGFNTQFITETNTITDIIKTYLL